jgi:hypothetical protein
MINQNNMTAVEWFYNQMENLRVKAEITNMDGNDFIIAKVKLLQEAKAMEKEQIIDAFVECWKSNVPDGIECKLDAEQYYNETFKSE